MNALASASPRRRQREEVEHLENRIFGVLLMELMRKKERNCATLCSPNMFILLIQQRKERLNRRRSLNHSLSRSYCDKDLTFDWFY